LILASSSSNLIPHLVAASFWWKEVGRMIGCGGHRMRELQIDRDGARSKGGPNRARTPLGRSERVGRPRPFLGRFGPIFLPSDHLGILDFSPLICVILRSSSLRSRLGVFPYEVRTLRLSPRGWSVVRPWSLQPLEVISPCTRTRTELVICSFELVVTPSLLSMFSCKNTILPNAHMKLNLLYH
jgi:hypothetical protein